MYCIHCLYTFHIKLLLFLSWPSVIFDDLEQTLSVTIRVIVTLNLWPWFKVTERFLTLLLWKASTHDSCQQLVSLWRLACCLTVCWQNSSAALILSSQTHSRTGSSLYGTANGIVGVNRHSQGLPQTGVHDSSSSTLQTRLDNPT